jgi:hypothetical protein
MRALGWVERLRAARARLLSPWPRRRGVGPWRRPVAPRWRGIRPWWRGIGPWWRWPSGGRAVGDRAAGTLGCPARWWYGSRAPAGRPGRWPPPSRAMRSGVPTHAAGAGGSGPRWTFFLPAIPAWAVPLGGLRRADHRITSPVRSVAASFGFPVRLAVGTAVRGAGFGWRLAHQGGAGPPADHRHRAIGGASRPRGWLAVRYRPRFAEDLSPPRDDPRHQQDRGEQAHPD